MLPMMIFYLGVLSLLLFIMVIDRSAKMDGTRFLRNGQFWEVYVIGISLVGIAYWIATTEEIQFTNILSLN